MIVKAEEMANMSMCEILENAIQKEIDAFDYYNTAAKYVGNEKIKSLLLTLATIEEGHRKQLEGHLTELKAHDELCGAMPLRYEKG